MIIVIVCRRTFPTVSNEIKADVTEFISTVYIETIFVSFMIKFETKIFVFILKTFSGVYIFIKQFTFWQVVWMKVKNKNENWLAYGIC